MVSTRSIRRAVFLGVLLASAGWASGPLAAEDPSAVGALMRLLKSGRLPEDRLGNVVELVCRHGNAYDLAYILAQSLNPEGYSGPLQLKALRCLANAALTRKVQPKGDLSVLGRLIVPKKPDPQRAVQIAAIRLAGIWHVEAIAAKLQKIALDETAVLELREAAAGALVRLGTRASFEAVEKLSATGRPRRVRYLGIAAMTALDLDLAAARAAALLASSTAADDPTPVLAAFLQRNTGSDKLAAALSIQTIPSDVAKLALRYMVSLGRSDPALSAALEKAAGINTQITPLSAEQIEQLAAEVLSEGDPARGETIFRRPDLSCMKCHSVSKAGGNVGPDLSALGSSSPLDYVIKSILLPNQAVKEQYRAAVIVTAGGQIVTGIVVEENDDRIVLKDANGNENVIAAVEIDEQVVGRSLMPEGITRFLTHTELVDLLRFLSELGKPGDYAIRPTPTIQRWRVLKSVPEELAVSVPGDKLFREKILQLDGTGWESAYAKVAGMLPLDELTTKPARPVLYLHAEVDVTVAGTIGVQINSTAGTHTWVDDQPFQSNDRFVTKLSRGRHKITLRIDISCRQSMELKVELFGVEGSTAEFSVVAGA